MIGRRSLTRVLTVGLLLAVMAGCGSFSRYNLPTYRYRLTVEVETPLGVRSGSSVIEVTTRRTSPRNASLRVRGEAVAVDLPQDQAMFALLRSEASVDWAAWVMCWLTPVPKWIDNPDFDQLALRYDSLLANRSVIALPAKFAKGQVSGPWEFPARPMLVRFRDIGDPKSVEKVDPDDLAKSFGKGVKLKRITVQITDDPVTTGIEKRFSWWLNHVDSFFDGTSTFSEDMTNNNLAGHLACGSFSTECGK